MGKVHCHVCGKKCKGDVLKLQDRYFHADCFKCKVCNAELANTGFFVKDAHYYCAEDYQKSFGTKCSTCGDFVEGEVVTALGSTFHQGCFKCFDCGKAFDPGDKVTYNGKHYYCRPCAAKLGASSPGSSDGTHMVFEHAGPGRTSTPVKKNIENGNTPKTNGTLQNDGAKKSGKFSFFTKKGKGKGKVSAVAPALNDSGLDHSANEDLITPTENQYQHRTPSPCSSAGSHSSDSVDRRRHYPLFNETGPYEPKFKYDYGCMYPASYLKQEPTVVDNDTRAYKRSHSPHQRNPPKSPHFHRPENFSYTKVKQGYVKPMKKGSTPTSDPYRGPQSGRRTPPAPMNNEEPIKLSHYPGANVPPKNFTPRIERPDWPGPPAPAVLLPEILRERDQRSMQKSVHSASEDEAENDDPKIEKEIREISKMANKSGMGQVILRDLEESKKKRSVSPVLDPWSCSRTPSAKREPLYRTRYESPIFASPSRDLDRPRVVHDDSQLHNRSATLPQYPDGDQSGDVVRPNNLPVAKPGYTFGLAAKSSSLPGSARHGVDLNDYADGVERRRPVHSYSHSHSLSDVGNTRDILYYSQGGRYQGSHYTEVLNHAPVTKYNKLRRSTPDIINPKKFYTYDQLKDVENLPKDVDRTRLECYLAPGEFEEIFGMSREEFFRQAEWRRVDIKERLQLNMAG